MSDPVRIPVGEGTPEGTNSAYLLPTEHAVVDPGPPTDAAWRDLRDGIEAAGCRLGDLERVFVTHWHADHAGLACRLADRTDATVHLHRRDAPFVGEYASARKRRVQRDRRTLERWGVPEPVRDEVAEGDAPSPIPDTHPVYRHDDGDRVGGIEFVHTPGHTAGHVSLRTETDLFLGDLLLPTYTPNVGGSDTRLADPLGKYLDSLSRIESARLTARPGHGTVIDVAAETAAVRRHHRERATAAFEAVADTEEPSTPWTVAKTLFGDLSGIHAKFGAGEAAAHLRRLAAVDVVERIDGPPVRFRATVEAYPTEQSLTPSEAKRLEE
ncbi:MBL fold metallo-hydrolase [Halorubrum salsamenti]|uniref:MBL fold metallo-hydrolase n=1 Tax=Halorubrum salsamenti TaxID=2583990 RepID=UPI0011A3CD56|nr:MBL fold metallo-hydrolase [Halorubrum salsamenti]